MNALPGAFMWSRADSAEFTNWYMIGGTVSASFDHIWKHAMSSLVRIVRSTYMAPVEARRRFQDRRQTAGSFNAPVAYVHA